jgi:uncharacterized Fe-S center protein
MSSKVYYVRTGDRDDAGSVKDKLARLIAKSGILDIVSKDDFTAIKIHFGEKGNTGHIRSEWAAEAARIIRRKTERVFLTDSNVIYKIGHRANSVEHLITAEENGFSLARAGVPVIIADGLKGAGFTEIPVDGRHFKKVKIASDFTQCDSMLVMSHMTGHILTGMGCAIKNIGMGCASRRGKYEQHCGAHPEVDPDHCVGCGACVTCCPAGCFTLKDRKVVFKKESCAGCGECAVICKTKAIEIRWSETLENLQQKMVEYACGAVRAVKGRVAYLNFLIRITKDCDCLAKDDPSVAGDIGRLASKDPVAIDRASVDMIIEGAGGDVFKAGYPETDWSVQLKYAEEMALGSQEYKLEEIK